MEEKTEIEILIAVVIILLVGGTIFYHNAENFSILDSFYLSVSTLSTVGYGDVVPHTKIGKIFTSFYILLGVGILLECLRLFTHNRVKKGIKFKKKKKQN
ncbi:MAG: two pore domain potassium channel family protein [Nanoarchaeota archaeon]|nr:two pore domain potassium channel family protein [Nanoarchaeota archaeon]